MCDQDHFEEDRQRYEALGLVTRKQFGMMLGAGMAMMLPQVANAVAVAESDVNVKTPDGTADCYFVHPASGTAPGVLMWPDIFGLAACLPPDGQTAGRIGLFGAGGESVLPGQESAHRGQGRGNPDPAVDAARAGSERDHAHDGCEGVHRLAGPAIVGCEESENGHARLLHGRPDGVSNRGCDARSRRRSRHLPWRRAGYHHAEQPASRGGEDTRRSFSLRSRPVTMTKRPTIRSFSRKRSRRPTCPRRSKSTRAAHGWCPPDTTVYNQEQAEKAWGRLLVLYGKALA